MSTTNSNAGGHALRIGGMALGNGLLLQTKTYWAAAIREENGGISLASGQKMSLCGGRSDLVETPLLRGPMRMLEVILLLVQTKRRLPSAVLPLEVPEAMASAAVSTMAIGELRRRGSKRRSAGAVLAQELLAAALAVVPAVVTLRRSRVAQYHGAEHKSIGAYELSVRDRPGEGAAKEHDRCGSNLVGPLLAANVAGNFLMRRVFREPPPGALLATSIASLGVAMEAFRWMTTHADTTLAKALLAPGRALQRFLTTDEPDAAQLEVGQAALTELLRLEAAGE